MLIDNINYLRKNYPTIREQLKVIEESEEKLFQIEETKKGNKTLSYINEGKKQYFHSKYDPLKEAQVIAEEYQNLEGKTLVFYGTGLGYHIDLIVKANPTSDIYIFEPIPELLEAFFSVQNISKGEYKNIKNIIMGFDNLGEALNSMLDINKEDIELIALPSHKKLYELEYRTFADALMNITKNKRSNITTNHAYQKRWTINSMKNFKEVLSTPNILIEKKDAFKDIPAIIVAAGPSLNGEIENIRHIKDNGLAYIFTVGSAINTLIHHGIYPHAATTYDPNKGNSKVFGLVVEKNIANIPMIFGSSVGYETLENYPGKKYHMVTSQDTVATYYLLNKNEKMDIVSDAPSIAVVTMQLLANLGFAPIILVGQNLAYLGDKDYAEGIAYYADGKSRTNQQDEKLQNAPTVEDVYSNTIKTNDSFNAMRRQMESYIAVMDKGRVVNTTKGGAKIAGADFRELKNIIENDLKERVYEDNWLDGNKTNYKKEVLLSKSKQMDAALEDLRQIIKEYNANLQTMTKLFVNRNFQQLDLMYNKQDTIIRALEANPFFKVFLQQMNRVHYELLYNDVRRLKIERNINEKHKNLLNKYQIFINQCSKDMEDISLYYQEINQAIETYCREKI